MIGRTVLAGLAGGIAMSVAMAATFRGFGFGWHGGGVLLDPALQSAKLIAVWTSMAPLPLVVAEPAKIFPLLVALSTGHAVAYRWLAPHWPAGVRARGLRLAGVIFFFAYVFWEIFTPYNQFGEPPALIALELVFWAIVALAEGLAIAVVMEGRGAREGSLAG